MVKDWQHDSLAPHWKGPNIVFLTTPVATAAAKSLQSCPTLCDPIDGSPLGSPVPGILQARILEWGAIAFSTPTAVKVAGVTPWIHHMRVRRTYHADLESAEWTTQKDPTGLRETKIILKKKQR